MDEVISSDLKDFSIPVTSEQREQFKCAIQAKYVEAIIDQLNDRFPNSEILSAFSIFDPHSLPSDEDELATYGQLSVDILMRAYGDGPDAFVDAEQCISEWESFKRLMKTNYSLKTMRLDIETCEHGAVIARHVSATDKACYHRWPDSSRHS